ncbi:hypothetical protein KDW07_26785 [Burkholderia dolosa]|uniref:hypothetical protein n=1 Tax=Burkholderia dolosa TaxID=152500 RepID=UPI001B8DDF20|nr:hypothetical protein [Burkholderia dolosa]MBR8460750.1 hypothetical protein [Burkholderia dolosa]
MLIAHGRDDKDHVCEVTGYEVQGPLRGESNLHRVFVQLVYRGTNTPNMRLLNDIRPLTKARSIAQDGA